MPFPYSDLLLDKESQRNGKYFRRDVQQNPARVVATRTIGQQVADLYPELKRQLC